jgi:hypothetical protein
MTKFEEWMQKDASAEFLKAYNDYIYGDSTGIFEIVFEAGQQAGKDWIPVNFPPEYKIQRYVSVKMDTGVIQPALYHPEREDINERYTYEGHTLIGIVSWQPLPEK